MEEENLRCLRESESRKKVVVGSKDIEKWIKGRVAKVNRKTGKAICPFAKRVLQDKAIQITVAKMDVLDQVKHCCSLFDIFNLDVVILYFDRKISEKHLSMLCRTAHDQNKEFAVMYDHPKNKGRHRGVSFSYGKAPLMFIQKLDKLKKAQEQLKKSGYYEAWGLESNDAMFF